MSLQPADDRLVPFRFEDLAGEPEPEAWGPAYNIKRRRGQSVGDAVREAHAAVWKRDPVFHTNSPSGQAFEFSAAKHRARLKAEFTVQCNAERRAWADGKPRKGAYGKETTILDAYEDAMKAKRLRESNANALPPRKPHYLLRAGQWVLAHAA